MLKDTREIALETACLLADIADLTPEKLGHDPFRVLTGLRLGGGRDQVWRDREDEAQRSWALLWAMAPVKHYNAFEKLAEALEEVGIARRQECATRIAADIRLALAPS